MTLERACHPKTVDIRIPLCIDRSPRIFRRDILDKAFPPSVLFKKTNPSANRSCSQAFLELTCASLPFESAQHICSVSIFLLVT